MADSTNADDALEALQERIGYRFREPKRLRQSLTHPSYLQQAPSEGPHYQRLEFLGDAILSAILSEQLFQILPREREGILSDNRAALARGEELSRLARDLGIREAIRLSPSEEQNAGRDRDSILEDALEALVGAIYLDSGWETTRSIVLGWYGDIESRLPPMISHQNPKGRLQEHAQAEFGNDAVRYRVVEESGPDHDKCFVIEVLIQNQPAGRGTGSSKKEAEENAAREALHALGETKENREEA